MKRRNFVKASLLTGTLTSILPQISLGATDISVQKKVSQEFYELRVYTLKNEMQQKIVEDYFKNAAIPAFNRLGSKILAFLLSSNLQVNPNFMSSFLLVPLKIL